MTSDAPHSKGSTRRLSLWAEAQGANFFTPSGGLGGWQENLSRQRIKNWRDRLEWLQQLFTKVIKAIRVLVEL